MNMTRRSMFGLTISAAVGSACFRPTAFFKELGLGLADGTNVVLFDAKFDKTHRLLCGEKATFQQTFFSKAHCDVIGVDYTFLCGDPVTRKTFPHNISKRFNALECEKGDSIEFDLALNESRQAATVDLLAMKVEVIFQPT